MSRFTAQTPRTKYVTGFPTLGIQPAIAAGVPRTGTFRIWQKDSQGIIADTGREITVANYHTGLQYSATTWSTAVWLLDEWVLIPEGNITAAAGTVYDPCTCTEPDDTVGPDSAYFFNASTWLQGVSFPFPDGDGEQGMDFVSGQLWQGPERIFYVDPSDEDSGIPCRWKMDLSTTPKTLYLDLDDESHGTLIYEMDQPSFGRTCTSRWRRKCQDQDLPATGIPCYVCTHPPRQQCAGIVLPNTMTASFPALGANTAFGGYQLNPTGLAGTEITLAFSVANGGFYGQATVWGADVSVLFIPCETVRVEFRNGSCQCGPLAFETSITGPSFADSGAGFDPLAFGAKFSPTNAQPAGCSGVIDCLNCEREAYANCGGSALTTPPPGWNGWAFWVDITE